MGVSYLLDTHAFFWLVHPGHAVPPAILDPLEETGGRVLVSPVSAFEVATKVRLGKFEDARPLVASWTRAVGDLGASELPLSGAHAVLAGTLDWEHKDPFDRLLVAQALQDGLTLVTADRAMASAPGLDILRWA